MSKLFLTLELKQFLIREYVQNRKSMMNVGKLLNISGPTIACYLKHFGIPLRTSGEVRRGTTYIMSQKHREALKQSIIIKNKKLYKKYKDQLSRISESFKQWFVGFFEGEGNFSHHTNDIPILAVSQNEEHVMKVIQEQFGFGNIYSFINKPYSTNRHYTLRIDGVAKCRAIAEEILEGRMRVIRKQEQFKRWLKRARIYNDTFFYGYKNSRRKTCEKKLS